MDHSLRPKADTISSMELPVEVLTEKPREAIYGGKCAPNADQSARDIGH
jgi:hypothetical protein